MIQILGLRDHTFKDKKTGTMVTKKREVYFEKGYRMENIADVFNHPHTLTLLTTVPETEHWNLYFTVADCFEEAGRKLKEQWAIPFDIDGLDLPEGKEIEVAHKAVRAACQALGIKYENTPAVFTGNGVQFFILLDAPITDEDYFDEARAAYGVLANRIQGQLDQQGIQGKIDVSVWSKGRLMRFPNTENRKPGKPTRMATILTAAGTPIKYDLVEESGIALIKKGEYIADEVLKNYPKPDTKAVLEGCLFLKHCEENAATLTEPEWYIETSIVARLDNGAALMHERSAQHPGYNAYEVDNKIEQAMAAAGPRTCKDIQARWGGCSACPHFTRITSPIMIKGEDYIGSNDFGFRERRIDKNGKVTPGRVLHNDLKKQFSVDHIYKVIKDTQQVIIYKSTHWEYMNDLELKSWCMEKVSPEPSVTDMNEFVGQLKAHNLTSLEELHKARQGFINFENCILNIHTGEVHKNNPDFGFFDVRPYKYNSEAKAPLFEKFVLDIMSGSEEKAQLLKEYAGYCISGDYPWLQKAMLLVGSGSNGKSLFVETLREVVGNKAYSSVQIQDLKDRTMRFALVNKLFNYSEETGVKSFADTDIFKTITVGGEVSVKQLYLQPYSVDIYAKLLIACNELPDTTDVSHGFTRRLEILHFMEKYKPGDGRHDSGLKDKLRQEIPGICNSIIKAYKECVARKCLLPVAEVQQAVQDYIEENDPIMYFSKYVMLPAEGARITVAELYEEYKIMCDRDNIRPKNATWFGRGLSKALNKNSYVMREGTDIRRYFNDYKINKDY